MLEKITIFSIIIMYNFFIHHLASTMYRNLSYNKKHSKGIVLLILSGVIGIVLAKIVLKNGNKVINKGLFYGGCLLILSGILINWSSTTDELKLMLTGGLLIGLIWFAHNKLSNNSQNENDKKKDKETDKKNQNDDKNYDDIDKLLNESEPLYDDYY